SRSAAASSDGSSGRTTPPGNEIWPLWWPTRSLRLAKSSHGSPRSMIGTSTAARISGPGGTSRRARPCRRARGSGTSSSRVLRATSPGLEARLALLGKGLRALRGVLGSAERSRQQRLEPQPVLERQREPTDDRLLGGTQGQRAALAQRVGKRSRRRNQLGQRHDLVDEAEAQRFVGGGRLGGGGASPPPARGSRT